MTDAIFFDLWNTLLYCPTKDMLDKIIERVNLVDTSYTDLIFRMRETLFIKNDMSFGQFIEGVCSERNIMRSKNVVFEAEKIWKSRLDTAGYFPETVEVLKALGKNHKLGLISNTDSSGAEYARKIGLTDYFDAIIMSSEVGLSKPDPLIYEKALFELGAKAGECLMIGDNPQADVYAAQKAGLDAVLIDRVGIHTGLECRKIKDLRGIIEVVV